MYTIFLPLVLASRLYYGLAVADVTHYDDAARLGATWSYDWTPSGDVPMLWSGKPSSLIPAEYTGWILVLNEPNVTTQANLSPSEAVNRLNNLRAYYPRARLICCGASVWAWDWMKAFWDSGGRPDAWHMHAYTESVITPAVVAQELTRMHQLTGGEYWITEYGSPAGNLSHFQQVTQWFEAQSWIVRIAPYTNRQPDGVSWALDPGVEMVNPDGSLTPIGAWYAGR